MLRNLIIFMLSIAAFAAVAETPLAGTLYMPALSSSKGVMLAKEGESEAFPGGENELFDSGEHKDIKTSFLLSLALPGAGEFYAGNKIKAGTFLAVEAAAWTGMIIYHKKGNDGEDSYRVFADEHWEFDYYYDWFRSFGDDSIYTEQLPVDVVVDGTDTTYVPNKTHDYYEMIGKYDWFLLGWEDLPNRDAIRDSSLSTTGEMDKILAVLERHQYDSDLRMEYMDMRKKTNDYFSWSKYFVGAAIFNHLLSAFDAAWTAKRSNDRLYEGFTFAPKIEAQISMTQSGEPEPKITINLARF